MTDHDFPGNAEDSPDDNETPAMSESEFIAFLKARNIPTADDYTPIPGEQLKQFLKKHRLTGGQAGRLVGVSSRTMRKYTGNVSDLPYAVWVTLKDKLGE